MTAFVRVNQTRDKLTEDIATLESRLQAQEQVQFRWSDSCSLDNDEDMFTMTASLPTSDMVKGDSARSLADMSSTSIEVESDSLFNTFFDADSVSTTTMSLLSDHTAASSISSESIQRPTRFYITNMMQAELDQLYFDRMHAAVPILHQRNYLSWSKSIVKTKSRMCLQYAVWATASLMSVQFQHLQDTIYPELKRALASIHLPSHPRRGFLELDVELVQAWILTATFEFVKTYHHEACISAGRAFRLVQLMGLHEMDLPSNFDRSSSASNGSDFIILEEKRRAFWMAFTLEALYSMRNNLPLVVNEHMVSNKY